MTVSQPPLPPVYCYWTNQVDARKVDSVSYMTLGKVTQYGICDTKSLR
jgi:hypothetical protein